MEYPFNQTAHQRACQDTESFRNSGFSFWAFEVVGAAVFGVAGALVGFSLTPQKPSPFWQNAWPTIGGGLGLVAGLVIVFLGIYLWNLFRAPYKQRNEARKELAVFDDKLIHLGYIEGLMYQVINLQKTLKYYESRGCPIDDYDIGDFRRWNDTASGYLQKNKPSEYPYWCKSVDIDLSIKPGLDTIVKAYDSGFEILRSIQKELLNSPRGTPKIRI